MEAEPLRVVTRSQRSMQRSAEALGHGKADMNSEFVRAAGCAKQNKHGESKSECGYGY